ncbi:hypothetical protein V5799_011250 [Amblyomma americanum]|uniref:Uncharacterized protein n=1 Tax=Amblyomma americanum TaxID=6943 RepID=A0AAQ4EHM8_AMBAM
MIGNRSYQLKPACSSNLVTFEDGPQNEQLRGVKQAVSVMQGNEHTDHRRLPEAVSKPGLWSQVSSLCLVLTAPRGQEPFETLTACRCHIEATKLFFNTCVSNIIELNMASFHFDCNNTNGSEIVASALPHLRALALAPCGVNQDDSLTLLARGCRHLEELDVRAERDSNRVCQCEFCRVPLRFSEADFKELHGTTMLRRLSLDDTAKMSSLTFLNECRVTELQFSLRSLEQESTDAAGFPFSLSRLLRSNPRLRQLTIEARDTPLRQNEFAEGLATVSTLRHLCVLTESITTEHHATSFFTFMQAELPLLEVLHAHYMDMRRAMQHVTWLRKRNPVLTTRLDNGEQRRLGRGVYFVNRPCFGCYRRTFIGLTKPRNRV